MPDRSDFEMTSASPGYVLEQNGRVWCTPTGGRRWTELGGRRHDAGLALAFGCASGGYLTLDGYPADQRRLVRAADQRQRPHVAPAADRDRRGSRAPRASSARRRRSPTR